MEDNKNINAENEVIEQEEQTAEIKEFAHNVENGEAAEAPVVEEKTKKSKKQIKAEQEEARKKELAALSDDELFARIQTEKLLKSRKTKRVATMATLCVAFVLALFIIVSAIVPINYVPACLSGEISSVKLYKSGSTSAVATITTDDERYATFNKLLNSSFSQSFLNALFSGSLTSYAIDETGGTSLEEYKGKDESQSLSSAISLAGDNYLIQFNFSELQTFKNQNGSSYISVYTKNSNIYYNIAYLSVSVDEDGGIASTEIYIPAIYEASTSIYASGYSMRIFTVTVKADTSTIYSNWSDLLA